MPDCDEDVAAVLKMMATIVMMAMVAMLVKKRRRCQSALPGVLAQ